MKLPVPYFSQFDDVNRTEWQDRACSITCLKMALEYVSPNSIPSIDDMIDQAVVLNGWGINGWIQDSLILMSHNLGVPAYRREFRSMHYNIDTKSFSPSDFNDVMCTYGIHAIQEALDAKIAVIVSSFRNWDTKSSFHTFLLVGYEQEGGEVKGFYYHDPDSKGDKKEYQFITLDDFKKSWRKFAIFVEKRNK